MIRSFRSKALKRLAERGDTSKLSVPNVRRVEIILAHLGGAVSPDDMNFPATGSTVSRAATSLS